MLKKAQRFLAGIAAALLIGWFVQVFFGGEWIGQQWLTGSATVTTILAGLLHMCRRSDEDEDSRDDQHLDPARDSVPSGVIDPTAQPVGFGGDPLGRWWRRQT
ncbi:hypothetical protein [Nesterenkonia jeotgali]|uniref:Cadmium resistance protein CadD (Predicted permease) n=1 Tax=Nesterenkonia jeotgali TaxID=317018 RepID=A0A839FTQ0_9MICC|nr:hypothetical protein [Nesterenkonia jeotgali]MBA8921253.1 cadmium resistance protein CadD (predicted permease) [Nesterenkonia jeotgali]